MLGEAKECGAVSAARGVVSIAWEAITTAGVPWKRDIKQLAPKCDDLHERKTRKYPTRYTARKRRRNDGSVPAEEGLNDAVSMAPLCDFLKFVSESSIRVGDINANMSTIHRNRWIKE